MNLSTNAPSSRNNYSNGSHLSKNTNSSSSISQSHTAIDTTATRICRRITFLYANDMMMMNHHNTNTTNTNNNDTSSFHYLQQSSVPFHQSTYTIHEYTCGSGGGGGSSQNNTPSTPKIVATTPISSSVSSSL
jgi:hypothetical protein